MLEQTLGFLGAALVLVGYTLMILTPRYTRYAYMVSLCGAGLLLWLAMIYHNIGLITLELAWIGINIWGLMRREEKQ